jgi:hypothetical protein
MTLTAGAAPASTPVTAVAEAAASVSLGDALNFHPRAL